MVSERECANAIRMLAIDAVEKANSGHPGMPMGMADIAEVLWRRFLNVNPNNPNWANRDRFVLSNGHGAMLLYSLLHLTGFDVSIEDIKQFRQLDSKTPGHPEFADTPGVETTTGPLGQGLANAVGMALAEELLAAEFNRPDFPLVNHYTYAFVGDGCLMEGISHEASSLAGTWGLGKLIVFWDDNGISIDGDVTGWFTDDTPARFAAYHWQVIRDIDGHDPDQIQQAILQAQNNPDQPTLICCKTTIGYGSPNLAGSAKTHGAPLGEAEIAGVREQLNWHYPPFNIPENIYSAWDARDKGQKLESQWNALFAKYESQFPELAADFLRRQQGFLPAEWNEKTWAMIHTLQATAKATATRKSSQQCLDLYAPMLPELVGGSADLTGSNCTKWADANVLSKTNNSTANYIEYGVREFAMSAIMNGMALHRGFIPFGGTFLTFADYAKNALRLASLMRQRVIYVYSHDSIGLGEDGPTHQPIEQLPMLRLMPNLDVWRPCDTVETVVAWQQSLNQKRPSCLLLTRQTVAQQERDKTQVELVAKGGYILWEASKTITAIIIATGSEVSLGLEAAKSLAEEDIHVRVVSMPCVEAFKRQSLEYQEHVLPARIVARVAVEAAASNYWYEFVGLQGGILGIDHFGASAPAKTLFDTYGFTKEHVITLVKGVSASPVMPVNIENQ